MKENDYKTKLNELFINWENDKFHDKSSFIRDGIIDYKLYSESSPKIMFLLKESYQNGNSDFKDLAKDLNESGPYRNWKKNACKWIYAINEIYKNKYEKPKFPETIDINKEVWHELLAQIAVVNIKKSKGKKKSNESDLTKYSTNDAQKLKEQIKIIKPDIIICNSTWSHYQNIYDGEKVEVLKIADDCYKHNNALVIKFFHFSIPSIKGYSPKDLYDYLCGIIIEGKVFSYFKW